MYLAAARVAGQGASRSSTLGLPGVGTVREYRRYYPAGEVTGHVVGFTDVDDRGQEGLEAAFDHWLKGENGSKRVLQDRRGQVIGDVELICARRGPGRDLRTSIDLRLQYLAYRELKAAVADSRARSGSVVVLDPRTGEVLAMVNQPSYNPNDRVAVSARELSQPRGHRHLRARLELQAARDGGRARERRLQPAQHHRHVARARCRSTTASSPRTTRTSAASISRRCSRSRATSAPRASR